MLHTQGRLLQLRTVLGDDKFMPIELQVTERLADLFEVTLLILAEDTNITAKMLLHKPVTVTIHQTAQPARYFHGIVTHFSAGSLRNRLRQYVMQLTPKLGLLRYAADCRIFQHKSVIEIAKIIFGQYGITDYQIKCQGALKKREFCVQYRESTLNFLQRIFAEEGLCYFFKHTADKHILILKDAQTLFPLCPETRIVYTPSSVDAHLSQWQHRYQFYSGKFSHSSYNFEAPSASLMAQQEQTAVLPAAANYETYVYPGGHQAMAQGKTMAQQHFAAQQQNHDVVDGAGNYLGFSAGQHFKLATHTFETEPGEYLLTAVMHHAHDQSGLASHGQPAQGYHNSFNCIPAKTLFQPPLLPKQLIHGPQTAVVVGPNGESIHADNYGRVKIHFHWVRNSGKDEQSSCWVRVAQPWAGRGFGAFFLPRIGQEVLVQFLDGDPDRPLIVGSVHNAENLPPYALPGEHSRSGIKTQSTKGSTSDANELRFEDKQGCEEIYIHAQKDFHRLIQNDETVIVLKGNHKMKIETGESILEAETAITLKVGSNYLKLTQNALTLNGNKVLVDKG